MRAFTVALHLSLRRSILGLLADEVGGPRRLFWEAICRLISPDPYIERVLVRDLTGRFYKPVKYSLIPWENPDKINFVVPLAKAAICDENNRLVNSLYMRER